MSYLFYISWFALIAIAMYSWVPMIRCYGWKFLPVVPTMWRIHGRSKRASAPGRKRTSFAREIVQYLSVALIGFYFGGVGTLIGGSFAALAVARALFAGRVPIVLLLGTSSDSLFRLQRGLISLLHGGIVATLLNVNAASDGNFRYAGHVFRTFDDDDQTWKDSVRKIADCVALVVLDTRTESPIVEFESRWMAEEFSDKTLFIMGDNGETPALSDVTTSLPWVTYVPAVTVAALALEIKTVGIAGIPHLHRYISERAGLVSPAKSIA
ncbi:hypothetical protein [Stratiformator vulcanicus]|uniref:Uncharacterized protein n=1 Tax=Stratiformator vulcanicus TaxID=2527980 RepID=A0A517QY52_9PLAN|nr:hypothetical protein [Stratiformator vulcanicus]QDT36533.1 hypothetical protein Pan189_08920 [Stratiformator vulcanicus]